jgi:hypothetical protein
MDSILTTLQQIRNAQKRQGFTIFDSVPQTVLVEIERELGRKLPAEIHTFYSQCSGFWGDTDLFRVLSPADILEEIRCSRAVHLNQLRFPIADYMIFSDTWDLLLDEQNPEVYYIINDNHQTEEDVVLTSSLPEFISRFLADGVFGQDGNGGLYGWREVIKAQADGPA